MQLQPNQTIFDVAIQQYGNIQGVFNLIKDNDLNWSSTVEPGTELQIDDNVNYTDYDPAHIQQQTRNQIPLIAAEPNQNIFDVAIQQFGSIEGVFNFIKNNNISVSAQVKAGVNLNAQGEVIEKLVYNYFLPRQKPATGSEVKVDAVPIYEGIDYWAIEVDFVVQ